LAEVAVSKETREEHTRRELDLELDRELEDTFPASDALKITRRSPERRFTTERAAASKREAS
jgi:hypothetical protein